MVDFHPTSEQGAEAKKEALEESEKIAAKVGLDETWYWRIIKQAGNARIPYLHYTDVSPLPVTKKRPEHKIRLNASQEWAKRLDKYPIKKTEISGTDGQPITVIVKRFSEDDESGSGSTS